MKITHSDVFPLPAFTSGKYVYQSVLRDAWGEGEQEYVEVVSNDSSGTAYTHRWYSFADLERIAGKKNKSDFLKAEYHNLSALDMDGRFVIKLGWMDKAKAYLKKFDHEPNEIPLLILLDIDGLITPSKCRDISAYNPDVVIAFADLSAIRTQVMFSIICSDREHNELLAESYDDTIIDAVYNGQFAYGGNKVSTLGQPYHQIMQRIIERVFPYNTQFISDDKRANKRVGVAKYGLVGAGLLDKPKPFEMNKQIRKRITMLHGAIEQCFAEEKVMSLARLEEIIISYPFGMLKTAMSAYIVGSVIGDYENKILYSDRIMVSRKRGFTGQVIDALFSASAISHPVANARTMNGNHLLDINKDLTAFLNIGASISGCKRGNKLFDSFTNFTTHIAHWATSTPINITLLEDVFRAEGNDEFADLARDMYAIVSNDVDIEGKSKISPLIRLAEDFGRRVKTPKNMKAFMDECEAISKRDDYQNAMVAFRTYNEPWHAFWYLWDIHEYVERVGGTEWTYNREFVARVTRNAGVVGHLIIDDCTFGSPKVNCSVCKKHQFLSKKIRDEWEHKHVCYECGATLETVIYEGVEYDAASAMDAYERAQDKLRWNSEEYRRGLK